MGASEVLGDSVKINMLGVADTAAFAAVAANLGLDRVPGVLLVAAGVGFFVAQRVSFFPPFLTEEVLEQLGVHMEEEVEFQPSILLLFGE